MPYAIRHRIHHVLTPVAILLSILFASTTALPAPAASAQPPPPIAVDPQLTKALAADETSGYLIAFDEVPDLSPAFAMSWQDRGHFVVQQLQATADRSQQRVRSLLQSRGARFRSFWAGNIIVVERSNLATVNALQGFGEIAGLSTPPKIIAFDDQSVAATAAPALQAGVEPNLVRIQAPAAWALGYRGEGMVVASIDSGARYTHQALVSQYRGNQGGGTFDHNYSWWDPYGHSTAAFDSGDHGTHTIGTMVGSDGGANRIGVAPGAKWIACMGLNGVSGSNAALLECGQFMLAPWNLGGASPNPDKRPQVVNNSWGGCQQSYNGWYQGVVDAWVAAGIYPVFSAGNAGNCGYSAPPGLNTVSSPARYGNVTAVGSTGTSNGQYATHSNWGPTDRPDTTNPRGYPNLKPQVVAPGVSIRSTVSGSDSSYDIKTGTSMSAPQVAGTLALIWQAAPCLLGNYALSELVLEQSATPIPYASGNGDEGPGNVPNHATGWGEINAPAAVQQAQAACGTSGGVAGRVTNASTGQPVADALLTFAAQSTVMNLSAQSNAQGFYNIRMPSGSYTATTKRHGYYLRTDQVGVTTGVTTTRNLALTPIPPTIVSGTVRDGGGHGWPLYAKISITGYDTKTLYTNPATGAYTVTLYQSQAYTFTVEAIGVGYTTVTRALAPPAGSSTQHFLLKPASTCVAPGYSLDSIYMANFESSNGGFSASGTNVSWAWGVPTSGPGAAHSATRAWATNLSGDYNVNEVSYLTSPPIDLSAYAGRDLYLGWWQWLQTELTWDTAGLEASKDGGANWAPVYGPVSGAVDTAWQAKQVALDPSYAVANFQLRFVLGSDATTTDLGWYVDDVSIQVEANVSANQPPPCLVTPAALVYGTVLDRNTGAPVNGATVSIDGTPGAQTASAATPDDPALADGFFQLVVPKTGAVTLRASAPHYTDGTQQLSLAANAAKRQDLQLRAPVIDAPQAIPIVMPANRQSSRTLALTNSGSADAGVDIELYAGSGLAARNLGAALPGGETTLGWQPLAPLPKPTAFHSLELVDGALYAIGGFADPPIADVQRYTLATGRWDTTPPPKPTPTYQSCSAVLGKDIYLIGGRIGGTTATTQVQIFHTATSTWQTLASDPLPAPRGYLACAEHAGKIYAFGGRDSASTPQSSGWAYNPAAAAGSRWSPIAPLPLASIAGEAASANGRIFYAGMVQGGSTDIKAIYAYNPASNSWSSYPALQAGHGRGMVWVLDGKLYVGGGHASGRVEVYDLAQGAAGSWSDAAPFSSPREGATAAIDTAQHALYAVGNWNNNRVHEDADRLWVQQPVPWLSATPASTTIAPQQTRSVTLSINTNGLIVGSYKAQVLALLDRTPYTLAHPATTIDLVVATPGLAAGPSAAARSGPPGAQVIHLLTITNSGSYTDTFSIALGAHTWTVTQPSSVTLAAGASATIEVRVAVPANAVEGASESLTLTIASSTDPQLRATATRTTTVGQWMLYLPMVRR